MKIRAAPTLFWCFAALASISIGAAAGPVVWRLSGNDAGIAGAPPPVSAVATDQVDVAPILAFAPFGSAVVEAPVATVVGETTLGLVLLGVTIASVEADSRAIIAQAGEQAESFGLGSEVSSGVTLVRVAEDHVVLRVQDRLETLSFAAGVAGNVPAAGGGPDLMNLIPSAERPADGGTSNAPDEVIAGYRSAIQTNAEGVLSRLGLMPTDQGYLIADTASPGVRQAGFRPGDLVTTVNGRQVGDVASDTVFFDEVAASGRARVELVRDGQTIVLSFPLR